MRRILVLLLLSALALAIAIPSWAAAPSSEVMYRVTRVRDSIWRYDYTLVNKAGANNALTLFQTFFPYGSAKNIGASLVRAGSGWKATCQEQSLRAPDKSKLLDTNNGFYMARAKNTAKALRGGQSLTGFSVEFESLGPDLPGDQDYLAIHAIDSKAGPRLPIGGPVGVVPTLPPPIASYYEQGRTRLDPSVPEPVAAALMASGLVGLVVSRRRNKTAA